MKRIEVHRYETPTAGNGDCPYSLGIMNLTKVEADVVSQFASRIRDELRRASGPLPEKPLWSEAAKSSAMTALMMKDAQRIKDEESAAQREYDERVAREEREYALKAQQRFTADTERALLYGAAAFDPRVGDVQGAQKPYICAEGHQSNTDWKYCPSCMETSGIDRPLNSNANYTKPQSAAKATNRFSELELPDEPQAE